jgi:hypothetical protein
MAEKGAKAQAIGSSCGSQISKIRTVTSLLGQPTDLRLTAGKVADGTIAGPLVDAAGR